MIVVPIKVLILNNEKKRKKTVSFFRKLNSKIFY